MKKRILAVSLLFAGGVCTLLAADFWQTKKFTEWSEKEVRRCLRIRLGPEGVHPAGLRWVAAAAVAAAVAAWRSCPRMKVVAAAAAGGGGGGGGCGGGGGGGGGMGGGGGLFAQEIELTVRWITALPIKQAIRRSPVRQGSRDFSGCGKVARP